MYEFVRIQIRNTCHRLPNLIYTRDLFVYLAHEKPYSCLCSASENFLTLCAQNAAARFVSLCGAGLPAGGGGLAADPAGAEPGAGAG